MRRNKQNNTKDLLLIVVAVPLLLLLVSRFLKKLVSSAFPFLANNLYNSSFQNQSYTNSETGYQTDPDRTWYQFFFGYEENRTWSEWLMGY